MQLSNLAASREPTPIKRDENPFRTEHEERRAGRETDVESSKAPASPETISSFRIDDQPEPPATTYDVGSCYSDAERKDFIKAYNLGEATVLIHVYKDKGAWAVRKAVPIFKKFATNSANMFPSITEKIDPTTMIEPRDLADEAAKEIGAHA